MALLIGTVPVDEHRLGAVICADNELSAMRNTHFFSRADEPKVPQQAVVAAGRLGLDIPGVFDIVATNLPVRHWPCHCIVPTSAAKDAALSLVDGMPRYLPAISGILRTQITTA